MLKPWHVLWIVAWRHQQLMLGESSITPDLQSDHIYLRRKSTYRWLLLRDFLFCLSWWASAQFLTSPIVLFRLPVIWEFYYRNVTSCAVTLTRFVLLQLYCNRNPFVRVLQFNLFLPTCTRNMPRARIYLGILLFLCAVNLSTQGEWRISFIATPHTYTW